MLLGRAAALLALAGAAGCPGSNEGDPDAGDDGDGPETCPIGDVARPIEVAAVHAGLDGEVRPLADGATVELLRPIQGGKVIYTGFRARNLDGCNLQLTAALRDPATNLVIALEQRFVRLVPASDGWGDPQDAFYSLGNVPACPSASATIDIDQGTWRLEMRLEETLTGRSAELALDVAPRCLAADERTECECECDADYVLGEACPVDPA